MWYQVRQGRVIRARCDYILGTDLRRFKMAGIRGVMNYPLYHFSLRDGLLIFKKEAGNH